MFGPSSSCLLVSEKGSFMDFLVSDGRMTQADYKNFVSARRRFFLAAQSLLSEDADGFMDL